MKKCLLVFARNSRVRYCTDNHRIVSISQPYIRPIVRGKAVAPVEFGAKMDLSLDEKGMARIEKMSFDAYNESDVLIAAAERYFERTGHYPERILADKIYRNRNNLAYCREHRIRLSGPSLGRPKKNAVTDVNRSIASTFCTQLSSAIIVSHYTQSKKFST